MTPESEMPSIVSTAAPSHCTASTRQPRTTSPSTSTVQAPHTPCSQPIWLPVSARSSRRKSTSVWRASTRPRTSSPLTRMPMSKSRSVIVDPVTLLALLIVDDVAHDVDGAAQHRHRGFERAERGMRRQRDIVHARQRIVGLQRLGVKHIEPGMADAAGAQRIDEGRLIDQAGAGGIDENHAGFHRCELSGPKKAARLVVERQGHRDDIGARQLFVERHERLSRLRLAIPGDDFHADAAGDAQDLTAYAAEPDHAERLAEKLHAFVR